MRAHNQWLSKTRSSPYWTTSVFSSTVTGLVLITSSTATASNYDCLKNELSLVLRPTVSRPVSLGLKHPSAAYDQIFISV
jgi:hypothetical protein